MYRNAAIKKVYVEDGYLAVEAKEMRIRMLHISPNIKMNAYNDMVVELEKDIERQDKKQMMICGDFNAKAYAWGWQIEDERGQNLVEMFASKDMEILNRGNAPTFRRGDTISYIDVTAATVGVARRVTRWEVYDDQENLSDPNEIEIKIRIERDYNMREEQGTNWRASKTREEEFKKAISILIDEKKPKDTEKLMKIITTTCGKVLPKKTMGKKIRGVYWWMKKVVEAEESV